MQICMHMSSWPACLHMAKHHRIPHEISQVATLAITRPSKSHFSTLGDTYMKQGTRRGESDASAHRHASLCFSTYAVVKIAARFLAHDALEKCECRHAFCKCAHVCVCVCVCLDDDEDKREFVCQHGHVCGTQHLYQRSNSERKA